MAAGKTWSEQELIYLREHYGKVPTHELATELNRTIYSVNCRASFEGLTQKKPDSYSINDVEFIKTNMDTMSIDDMAKHLNRSASAIRKRIVVIRQIQWAKKATDVDLPTYDQGVPFTSARNNTLAEQHRVLLANMSIGDSYVYPAKEHQTLLNATRLFTDRAYASRRVDELTRRVWRLQ